MAQSRQVSDDKALLIHEATKRMLAVVSPHHTVHSAHRWVEDMEGILEKLPSWAINRLAVLIQDGPYERPES